MRYFFVSYAVVLPTDTGSRTEFGNYSIENEGYPNKYQLTEKIRAANRAWSAIILNISEQSEADYKQFTA